MIKIYQSIAQVQMVAPLQSAEPRGSPKENNEVHFQRRLLFKLFCSFLICYFLLLSTVNAQTHSPYWTASDVATYNAAYTTRVGMLNQLKGYDPNTYYSLLQQHGSDAKICESFALKDIGYTEVPVEGALRSDYTGTIQTQTQTQNSTQVGQVALEVIWKEVNLIWMK